MSTPDLVLQVGSQRFDGWKKIRVTTGIEQLAGDYELGCSDKWAIQGIAPPVLPGMTGKVLINDVPVITGFIDDADPEFDANSHDLNIRGRDFTGDLVDCSALVSGQSWINRSLPQMAKDLCKPFGIAVSIVGKPGPVFAQEAISPGESCHDVLARMAAMRGFLLVSDNNGGLLIIRAGTTKATTSLVLGQNILAARGTMSHRERYYTYRVVGQGAGVGGSALVNQQALGVAHDPEIRTSRVLTIAGNGNVFPGQAQTLANWNASNRAARGIRAEITVRGWLDVDAPWQPNTQVYVDCAWLRLKGWLLIAKAEFRLDDKDGAITVLTVTPKEAYIPSPEFKFDGISYAMAVGDQP